MRVSADKFQQLKRLIDVYLRNTDIKNEGDFDVNNISVYISHALKNGLITSKEINNITLGKANIKQKEEAI